jgi:hypothetical protein
MRTKLLYVFLLLGAFLCFTQPASAATVSFDLVVEISGAQTPAGSPSWGTATFDDGGSSGEVTLTMTENINQGTQTGEWFAAWYFNFNPDLDLSESDFASSETNAGDLTVNENGIKADGDGFFDFIFEWPNPSSVSDGSGFDSGSVTWIITQAGLTANDFAFLSVSTENGTDTTGGLPHVGRIRGLPIDGVGNEGSGWLSTPIPASALLLAPGLILLGALRRKFKS